MRIEKGAVGRSLKGGKLRCTNRMLVVLSVFAVLAATISLGDAGGCTSLWCRDLQRSLENARESAISSVFNPAPVPSNGGAAGNQPAAGSGPVSQYRTTKPPGVLTNFFQLGLRTLVGQEEITPQSIFDASFIYKDTAKYRFLRGVMDKIFQDNEVEIRQKIQAAKQEDEESRCVCACEQNPIIKDCEFRTLPDFYPKEVQDPNTGQYYAVFQIPEEGINQSISGAKMCTDENSQCNAGYGQCRTTYCETNLLVMDNEEISVKKFPYPGCCSCS